MEDYAEEDIHIDPSMMRSAFKTGIRRGKISYLQELQKMATNDYELEGEEGSIAQCFETVKRFFATREKHLAEFQLDDLVQFGLEQVVVDRIGYLAFQYESTSPKEGARSSRPFGKADAKRASEEFYDDDFEDIEDEVPNVRRESHLSGSDELYVKGGSGSGRSQGNNSGKLASNSGRNRYNYDAKHLPDDEFDEDTIEDETYDLNRNSNSRVAPDPMTNDTSSSAAAMGGVPALRASPEVVTQASYSSHRNSNRPVVEPIPIPTQDPRDPSSKRPLGLARTTEAQSPSVSASASGSQSGRASTAATGQKRTGRARTQGWITRKEWSLGDKIGSGSFGEVFRGLNDKGGLFAAKRMNMANNPGEVDNLLSEIQLMRGLSHPHIVEYLGAFVDAEEACLYIFQEWVPGGSVAHLLKQFGRFSMSVVREYTRQVCLGLEYLHSNGIIHRDIKGGNLLVTADRVVKLADFGASTVLTAFNKTQETTTVKGTPYFMAPEVLASSKYGRKGDVWAVGCTMIQMMTGDPPWKDRNLKGLVQLHLLLTSWDQGPPPYNCKDTPDARECLEMCFRKDEADRPSVAELLECRFLQEDELDESANSGSMNPSQHDDLENSGVIQGLKKEMHLVVSKSAVGIGHKNSGDSETINAIERQMAQQQRKSTSALPVVAGATSGGGGGGGNPYASNAAAAGGGGGGGGGGGNPYQSGGAGVGAGGGVRQVNFQQARSGSGGGSRTHSRDEGGVPASNSRDWNVSLPPSTFNDSPAPSPSKITAAGSPLKAPSSLGARSGADTPPNSSRSSSASANPSNPYRAGNRNPAAVKPLTVTSPQNDNPYAKGKKTPNSGPPSRSEDLNFLGADALNPMPGASVTPRIGTVDAVSAAPAAASSSSSTAGHQQGASHFHHQHTSSTGAAAGNAVNVPGRRPSLEDDAALARESLHNLKRRTNAAHVRRGSGNSGDGSAAGSAMAVGARAAAAAVGGVVGGTQLPYGRNSNSSTNRDNNNNNNYSNNANLSSHRDSEDLTPGAVDEVSDGEDMPRIPRQATSEEYIDSNKGSRHDDEYGVDIHKQDSLASIEDEALNFGAVQSQRARTQDNNDQEDDGDEPYHVRNSSRDSNSRDPYGARQMSPRAQIHPSTSSGGLAGANGTAGMLKSASDAQFSARHSAGRQRREVGQGAAMVSNSISGSGGVSSSSSGRTSAGAIGAVERRAKPYPSKQKSLSAKTRRADPMAEPQGDDLRPNTSKAALAGGAGAGQATGNAPHRRGSGSSTGSNSGAPPIHPDYQFSYDEADDDDEVWLCLKCGAENSNSPHCEHCATRRGADGKRGSGARIHRLG